MVPFPLDSATFCFLLPLQYSDGGEVIVLVKWQYTTLVNFQTFPSSRKLRNVCVSKCRYFFLTMRDSYTNFCTLDS